MIFSHVLIFLSSPQAFAAVGYSLGPVLGYGQKNFLGSAGSSSTFTGLSYGLSSVLYWGLADRPLGLLVLLNYNQSNLKNTAIGDESLSETAWAEGLGFRWKMWSAELGINQSNARDVNGATSVTIGEPGYWGQLSYHIAFSRRLSAEPRLIYARNVYRSADNVSLAKDVSADTIQLAISINLDFGVP